jgi:hypothetical protein
MFNINKISLAEPIDFAASELKKYLRMMMPEGGDLRISYAPDAKTGFRLGLMSDFGLDTSDAEDVSLDDILYIDADEKGGIIAGSNPRSVLLSVYEYLRQNGCRWLYPGTDGEYIPERNITSVKLRHKPSMRCRGFAAEGSVYQDSVLNMLDFLPKVGMNTYMIEFRLPRSYYSIYYMHLRNLKYRPSEPISESQVMQWKRQSETEIAKRGLLFHDVGHGWTIDPFGIDSKHSWRKVDPSIVPKDTVQYLAEIGGKRGLFEDTPINTNFCMSNATARKMFCDYVVKYAEEHPNADYLQVWLADSINNHCECEECKKKIPSDYYVILMNELDEALTAKGLDTKIAFIAYLDTVFPPLVEKIKNSKRFCLMFAYISRNYADTKGEGSVSCELKPYVRNKIPRLGRLDDALCYYRKWQESFGGDGLVFEYHFWRHLYYDISGLQMARRIYEDIALYRENGFRGFIENGTLRPFFPSGIAFYTYAKCLYDETLSFEEICRDYFSHIYGKDYEDFVSYLEKLNALFPYRMMETNSEDGGMKKTLSFEKGYLERLDGLEEALAYGRGLIDAHYNADMRVQTVSVRLLEKHQKYVRLYADAIRKKVLGDHEGALKAIDHARESFGEEEIYIQPYYDHTLNFSGLGYYFDLNSNPYIPEAAVDI